MRFLDLIQVRSEHIARNQAEIHIIFYAEKMPDNFPVGNSRLRISSIMFGADKHRFV